jgi:hypothetical protein
MRTIISMLLYCAAAAAMMFFLVGGPFWLIRPDPTFAKQIRQPPAIPQRIADSIERKRASVPEQPKETSVMRPVSASTMKTSPVALTQPALQLKIREIPPRPSKKVKPKPRNKAVIVPPDETPVAQPLPTARTDFPY